MLSSRHIGLSATEQQTMLAALGCDTVATLIDQVIPADIRRAEPLDFPALSEHEYLNHIHTLCTPPKSLNPSIPNSLIPSVIRRCVLENPSWYTSYTPYQAEISQGRLEALFAFQTVVSDLTGLPLANCSLLDEATAAAEAVTMMMNLRSRDQQKAGLNRVFVDEIIDPATRAVLCTRAAGQGIELVFGDYRTFTPSADFVGAVISLPNAHGSVEDYTYFVDACHKAGLRVTCIADLLALALVRPVDADICVGSAAHLGLPAVDDSLHLGYMATRDEFKRDMPGRIIGLSRDAKGHPAYRLALQTREQHIKRERATSNICTASALSAMMAAFYAIYHGPEGLRAIAESIHSKAAYLGELLQALGAEQTNVEYFDTLRFRFAEDEDYTILTVGESTTFDDMNSLITDLCERAGWAPMTEDDPEAFEDVWALDEQHVRPMDYLQHPIFARYHTETEMMRYLKTLERRDISLTDSMIPLGSCTMKLNPASAMIPVTTVSSVAPIAPELRRLLAEITGFGHTADHVCLQPTSGAAGEYAGLVTIRRYYDAKGQTDRRVLLIPASAHGTNPASCVQAGFTPVVVACDQRGNTDLADWCAKAEQYRDTLAGCMITYPSTHGIFETAIRQMCDTIHAHGGLVYMDGANMNAQIGYTDPATIGADVCHLNLHKSFAAPHGGGGPGAGAVCAGDLLMPYLPSEDEGRVSTALHGNLLMALISYGYIRMMGGEGLTEATAAAILAANYLAVRLRDAYGIVYTGESGRVGHELILDCRQFHAVGITETDIAKRLMDYGYHAPTLSFPVHGTLMVEPTESESLAELDRFADALLAIRAEIAAIETAKAEGRDTSDNLLVNAPHPEYELTADEWHHPYSRSEAAYPLPYLRDRKFMIPVARVDNGFGDRNLIARF